MDRRQVLRAGVVGVGAVAFSGALWQEAFAAVAQPGPSPYGGLSATDANGLALPAGFTSRVIARSGQDVPGTGYGWHWAPDGGACFADGAGWIYVSNSEIPVVGGASAIRFSPDGNVHSAYGILSGTSVNCAGGATPWHTWLSCEEIPLGRVMETDPWGVQPARERTRLGRFKHEAAACDPDRRVVYLTEDEGDGCFYRFVPDVWGDLNTGRLQVLCGPAGATSGPVTWQDIPDRDGFPVPTRRQVGAAMRFDGGEGCWYDRGTCYFTTKGDNRVWAYDAAGSTIALAYDDSLVDGTPPLTGVDNITGAPRSADLYVAEDGGNMEINVITAEGVVAPFLRLNGQGASEITGPAFNPAGNRLYFSSQRGATGAKSGSGGITYEVTGPFRSVSIR
ncbi:alkaline phosphatase PhoX [Catellatospora vulcania]|uniref:alkaline phosphatase PhoX n=1 Tax=Catellatospora vulcania TaxID=1460450 RepID=UPI0012D3CF99|nr:alkaline phosphatase PhoX [Catellatospora vulcania]